MIETADIAELREELVRRFRTTTRELELAGRTIRLLMPANADELISEADFDRDERLPYWADLWPSARILAEELAVMRLRGQRVLELGCGLGVVAIGAVLGGVGGFAGGLVDRVAFDHYPLLAQIQVFFHRPLSDALINPHTAALHLTLADLEFFLDHRNRLRLGLRAALPFAGPAWLS